MPFIYFTIFKSEPLKLTDCREKVTAWNPGPMFSHNFWKVVWSIKLLSGDSNIYGK
jgi:hypothetical protein